jgi:hypothetical protein
MFREPDRPAGSDRQDRTGRIGPAGVGRQVWAGYIAAMQQVATFPGNCRRLEAAQPAEEAPMTAQLSCFVLGALAPLAIVGWLLAQH